MLYNNLVKEITHKPKFYVVTFVINPECYLLLYYQPVLTDTYIQGKLRILPVEGQSFKLMTYS